MADSKLENMVDPQVVQDMVGAKLPNKIKFTSIAHIDNTLEGVPGSEITVPCWNYIGDADEVAEGEEVQSAKLTASTTKAKVKKAMKSVTLTDEAVLCGHGDPIGQATSQLTVSLASKIDNDIVDVLEKAQKTLEAKNVINYSEIVDGLDLLSEEDTLEKVIFIHSKQLTQLRKDPEFIAKDKYGGDVMVTGEVGMIGGAHVVTSNRVKKAKGSYLNPIVVIENEETVTDENEVPAVTLYTKRDAMVETDRIAKGCKTDVVANQFYAVALTNQSKVALVKFKETQVA